ncbi:SCAN domain-containing protein 3-like [Diorhabda sublineata]|uniref:SCAN domain-containing protein 3-like n=1 Tax=Diorhabda sublineata TaxID=1163346 RepID=UPI0024E0A201|nr:SCAN domain-containing protein 3-like [Diorhabda sublineata]
MSLELAKAKKPFTDGNLIEKCAVEMAKAFEDSKMAEKFQSVPLSHQTIQRRIVAMGEQVEKSLPSLVKKSSYFSLCLDESTDQSDVSQLLIFVRTTFDDFKEELFDICPLYGTTKGKDIYEAVKKAVDRIGGFDKCLAIATDGAPSMTDWQRSQVLLEAVFDRIGMEERTESNDLAATVALNPIELL